eukprot:TRINITY_DN6279_c0_g3_i2.p1 TRINITY_DN6279_c0_g3~~TRINITY_DN6279_c0_g3_i2.p1  ORF type:complete len:756 (-),score=165.11 TRINITY_DN6279_c0_g3_i2:62-2290(-)
MGAIQQHNFTGLIDIISRVLPDPVSSSPVFQAFTKYMPLQCNIMQVQSNYTYHEWNPIQSILDRDDNEISTEIRERLERSEKNEEGDGEGESNNKSEVKKKKAKSETKGKKKKGSKKNKNREKEAEAEEVGAEAEKEKERDENNALWVSFKFNMHLVRPTHYTLRRLPSSRLPHPWLLQGLDQNLHQWITLSEHKSENSFKLGETTHTFEIPVRTVYFEQLRLISYYTEEERAREREWKLPFTGFELYGDLKSSVEEGLNVVHTIWCDGCGSPRYRGVRYRCLDCTSRVRDLCSTCYRTRPRRTIPGHDHMTHRYRKMLDTEVGEVGPPHLSGVQHHIYESDFDDKGIIYHLGSLTRRDNDKIVWRNPAFTIYHLTKDLLPSLELNAQQFVSVFRAEVGLLDGNIASSLEHLERLLADPKGPVPAEYAVEIPVFFAIFQGVLSQKSAPIVRGLPSLVRLFRLPKPVACVVDLVVLLANHRSGKEKKVKREDVENVLREFGNEFKIDEALIAGIIAVSRKDIRGLARLAERFGALDPTYLEYLVMILEYLQNTSTKSSFSKLLNLSQGEEENGGQKKPNAQGLNLSELFDSFDKNCSGVIDYAQFVDALKFMGLDVSPHKVLQIFTEMASPEGKITKAGFEHAIKSLQDQIANKVLDFMGLSLTTLIQIFLVLVILVLLIFIFIFLGISAFKVGSTFGTVINSLLPVLAALGVGQSGAGDVKQIAQKAEIFVRKVMAMIKRAI